MLTADLTWEVVLGYSGGPNVITKVLRGKRGEAEEEMSWLQDLTNAVLLALKTEQGTMNQCMWVASRARKCK